MRSNARPFTGPSRLALISLAVMTAATTIAFVHTASGADVTPAANDEPSYQLSGFNVSTVDSKLSGVPSVEVSFVYAWSSATYPGEAQCYVEVLDPTGATIWGTQFGLDSYQRSGTSQVAAGIDTQGVAKATATGYCSAAPQPAAGSGYEVSDLTINELGRGDLRLAGVVHWRDGSNPGVGQCTATITKADRKSTSIPFTLSVADGDALDVVLDGSLKGATPEAVDCVRFTGE